MRGSADNLFVRLSKWAMRQGEHFLTEAFVVTLQSLVAHQPAAACLLVEHLTGGFLVLQPQHVGLLKIDTQSVLACGRPDLILRTADSLVYIEDKDFAEL